MRLPTVRLVCGSTIVAASLVVPLIGGLAPWLYVRAVPVAAFLVGSAVARARGMERRLRQLFVLCGCALALINIGLAPSTAASALRVLTGGYPPFGAALIHLLIVYPSGRLRGFFEHTVVISAYVIGALYGISQLVIGSSNGVRFCDPYGCAGLPSPPIRSDALAKHWPVVLSAIFGLLILAALVAIIRRFFATPERHRHAQIPAMASAAAGAGLGLLVIAWRTLGFLDTPADRAVIAGVFGLGVSIVPLTLIWGMVRARMAVFGLGDFVAEPGPDPGSPRHVSQALSRLLADPTVELLVASPDGSTFHDQNGAPARLPEAGSPLTWTPVGTPPIAAIVYRASSAPEPRILQAAVNAVGLVLDNVRLQGQLQIQLQEVKASRARIVAAADDERRRIERNLHDGAQQHLVSSALSVRLARQQIRSHPELAEQMLADTERQLRDALSEIRRLARGIHPAVLVDHGLGAAVESLALRLPLDVTITDELAGRLAAELETAAYFVVCEALVNVVKHAGVDQAEVHINVDESMLEVQVSDRGTGGADPALGTGLLGLGDRLSAVHGTVDVLTSREAGTRVVARLPLPDSS